MPAQITLAGAEKAIEAGKAKADELGIAFTASIVDAGTHLIAVARMDGAALASVETSQSKARTSVLFAQPTRDLAPAVQPGALMFGIEASTRDPLAFVAGGIPVTDQHGLVISAIGVGGGTPDDDHQVAVAMVTAL